jgi:formamidase
VFEGLSVDETGKQHYLDATVAYKRAVLNAIAYLSKFGYTRAFFVCLCGCLGEKVVLFLFFDRAQGLY